MSKTIRIRDDTVERISKYGTFGMSWDDLLNKLCDIIEEKK